METLKYKVIKSRKQYNDYCKRLDEFVTRGNKSKSVNEEIELLTFLIEKWDNDHNSFHDVDPVQLLKTLMQDRNMKPVALVQLLGVSKSLVSDILNYKKGLSKAMIRKLSETFKLSHEAFNRHYELGAMDRKNRNIKVIESSAGILSKTGKMYKEKRGYKNQEKELEENKYQRVMEPSSGYKKDAKQKVKAKSKLIKD